MRSVPPTDEAFTRARRHRAVLYERTNAALARWHAAV